MFTGIIQEVGIIDSVLKRPQMSKIGISLSEKTFSSAENGDSIAVDGVCLTVVDKKNDIVFFEAVKSTIDSTTVKSFKKGQKVNIEPALKVGDKLGGHFVLGHIDCTCKIKAMQKLQSSVLLKIDLPSKYKNFVVEKGSVAINGISLTIQKVYPAYFELSIIPYTFAHTCLNSKRAGDLLNVEFDYLLKSKEQ